MIVTKLLNPVSVLSIMESIETRAEELNDLNAFLNQLRPDQKQELAAGLEKLRSLDDAAIDRIAELALQETTRSMDVDPVRFAVDVQISETTAQALVPILPMLLAVVAGRSESAELFAEAFVSVEVAEKPNRDKIIRMLRPMIAARPDLRRAIEESHLADSTLPSVNGISFSIDVRLAFDQGGVSATAPVAIIYLKTDIRDVDIHFQAKPSDLRYMISTLSEALKQLEMAKNWVAERPK